MVNDLVIIKTDLVLNKLELICYNTNENKFIRVYRSISNELIQGISANFYTEEEILTLSLQENSDFTILTDYEKYEFCENYKILTGYSTRHKARPRLTEKQEIIYNIIMKVRREYRLNKIGI